MGAPDGGGLSYTFELTEPKNNITFDVVFGECNWEELVSQAIMDLKHIHIRKEELRQVKTTPMTGNNRVLYRLV